MLKGSIPRALVREALSRYLWPKIVIDPVKPGNENLYNAEYEHKKEVFGNKAIKDFIIMKNQQEFTLKEIQTWFEDRLAKYKEELRQPQVENQSEILNYLNSLIVAQVEYILDTITEHDLDFYNAHDVFEEAKKYDAESRFPAPYREFIHKTFHGIDEKAFYLFKYAYERDRRFAYERIEWYHDFDDYLPITMVDILE